MNEANQIGVQTKLFGFIAEKAQSNRFSVILNKTLNIREDDLYFTVSNMRKSQLSGAAISAEYQKEVLDILDGRSDAVSRCGYCDTIRIVEGKLHGEIASADALMRFLKERGVKKVAVIGGGALARSLALAAEEMQLHFYHEYVEALMEMSGAIGAAVDVNRCAEGMQVDLSGYDAVVDAGRMAHLEMVSALAPLNVDLKPKDAPSALRTRCNELGTAYAGYEELLPYLTQTTYDIWMHQGE